MGALSYIANLMSTTQPATRDSSAIISIEGDLISQDGVSLPGGTTRRQRTELAKAYVESAWLQVVVSKMVQSIDSLGWSIAAATSGSKVVADQKLAAAGYTERRRVVADRIRAGTVTEFVDHPAIKTLSHGIAPGTTLSVPAIAALYIQTTGESFFLKLRNGNGVLTGYVTIPPQWVNELPTPKSPYFSVTVGGKSEPFPLDRIVWIKRMDPTDPGGHGISLAKALGNDLDADRGAAQFTKQWWEGGALPPIVVSGADGGAAIDVTERKRLERRWLAKVFGPLRRIVPVFLSHKVDITKLSDTFKDMDISTFRKAERDIIVQASGTQPEVVGITENSNRATISAAYELYARTQVVPMAEMLCRAFQRDFQLEFDQRLILLYTDPVPESVKDSTVAAAKAPWAPTMNEWRRWMNLPPDDTPAGDMHAVQGNVVFMSSQQVAGGGIPSGKAMETREPCACEHEHSVPSTKGTGGDEIMAAIEAKYGKKVADLLRQALEKLKGSVNLDALVEAVKNHEETMAEAIMEEGMKEGWLAEVITELRDALGTAGGIAADLLETTIGASIKFDVNNPAATSWAEAHAAALVKGVTDETRAAIHEAIVDAFDSGRTAADIAKQLREIVGLTKKQAQAVAKMARKMQTSGYSEEAIEKAVMKYTAKLLKQRAETIAQNELNMASNQGQSLAWEQAANSGLLDQDKWERVWIITTDACELCVPMSGVRAPIGGVWETANGAVSVPTEIHVRCRCAQGLVAKGG